jgi:hypothetical protein
MAYYIEGGSGGTAENDAKRRDGNEVPHRQLLYLKLTCAAPEPTLDDHVPVGTR